MRVDFVLKREIFQEAFTLGTMLKDGEFFAFTCEDQDRKLEDGGEKVPGATAIPLGKYRLTATISTRFSRLMPLVQDVPGFSGIRIHGGNTAKDTEGCPLIGALRTGMGVAGCAEVVARLIKIIVETEAAGGECWLEVTHG